MSNKPRSTRVQPAYYPGTSTLINHLGIQDPDYLAQKEADFTVVRGVELLQQPSHEQLTFDLQALRSIHHHLFQDLYSWAGLMRSFDFRKGGDQFMPASDLEIPERIKAVFSSVDTLLKDPSAAKDPDCLSALLNRLNFYHPFPEGNGRAQRIFMSLLVKHHGYDLAWNLVKAWEMKEVCQQAHVMNLDPMRDLFRRILRRQ